MPKLNDYINALRESVGEEKMRLAFAQLIIAKQSLTPERKRKLESVPKNSDRLNLLNSWFGDFLNSKIKNLISLLAKKNQLSLLSNLQDNLSEKEKITVTIAKTLDSQTKNWLIKELEAIYGASPVNFVEDQSLIGGVKIRVGDKEIDSSLSKKLESISNS